MFQKLWIQSKLYRRIIHKLYSIQTNTTKMSFPIGILGDFNVHYIVYDKFGNVKNGYRPLRQALANRQNYGISVLYE